MIGVFGGTFNPIHSAHIQLALEVQQLLQLDHVRMIPCSIPPHREAPAVSPETRYVLLQNAIKPYPELVADDRELKRSGPSYMIDTLESLKSEFADTLCLIVGSDAYNKLDSWKKWRSLIDLAHIVVMKRPVMDQDKPRSDLLNEFTQLHATKNINDLRVNPSGKIIFIDNTEYDISSSEVREKLAAGLSLDSKLPESVNKEIKQRDLYGNHSQ